MRAGEREVGEGLGVLIAEKGWGWGGGITTKNTWSWDNRNGYKVVNLTK